MNSVTTKPGEPHTSSAVTLATPAGLHVGDVEIAQISAAAAVTVTSVPAGWNLVREDATGSDWNNLRQDIYYHVAGSAEPAVNAWGLSQAVEANGGLTAWSGVNSGAPIETSSGNTGPGGGTGWTAP
jgi:hypothetical protein